MGSLWVAWELLSSSWERKQAVHFCCTIQLAPSFTDKKLDQITQRLFVTSCASVAWLVLRLETSSGQVLIESSSRHPEGNTSSNSRVKAGMVLTSYFLALFFIWTGVSAQLVLPSCDQHKFDSDVENCLSDFNRSMETAGLQSGCPWPAVKGFYDQLKLCVDDWASALQCNGHGYLVDNFFLRVHTTYFWLCGQVQDPPFFTLIMLIAPGIIATLAMPVVCVKLTTWDTE